MIWVLTIAALTFGCLTESRAAGETKDRLSFSGDIRGRFEVFKYSIDATGNEKDTRSRIRYRFRLNGKAIINNRANFQMLIGTGLFDNRSGNVTLGDPVDFGVNAIGLRRAFLTLSPWEHGKLPGDRGHWDFQFGRVANPFLWKHGLDKMLWDNDLAFSGINSTFDIKLGDPAVLFINAGYYYIDENSSGADPYLASIQAGVTGGGEKIKAGIRGTFHHFDELDTLFVQRGVDGSGGATESGGNVPDGMTGSVYGGRMNVIESQVFITFKAGEVPLTVYGGGSQNMDAEPSDLYGGVGKNDIAYNAGFEGGDSKKWIELGGAWYHIEANAFPSQFIDSDFLDGRTNRKGLLVYVERRIMKNSDFMVQAFNSDAIKTRNDLGNSVKNAERFRLQVDLIYKF
jgi:hypothetical protein